MKSHEILLFLVFVVGESFPKTLTDVDVEKMEFCSRLNCRNEGVGMRVCGLRAEGEGFRLKLFENECELLKYGCSVDETNAYGLINTEYCDRSFGTSYESVDDVTNDGQKLENDADNPKNEDKKQEEDIDYKKNDRRKSNNDVFFNKTDILCEFACDNSEKKEVCGIRIDGDRFRIRLFDNYCELTKHNCMNKVEFIKTDLFICKSDLNRTKEQNFKNTYEVTKNNALNGLEKKTFEHRELKDGLENGHNNMKYYKDKDASEVNKRINNVKNFVVVNSKIFGQYDNINDSIDTFFALSHVYDLPLKEVQLNNRRAFLKRAGPIKVYVPWITKPKNVSNDTFHTPTLTSCYHKCPTTCPSTYAPVCGVPGVLAREPALMFLNHCFMDVAQCKLYWENKSYTARSIQYVESAFMFCMGDEMDAVYRFMPALRTLQHMGRLKKKGKFRSVLRNFRFVSNFRYAGRPKFMGRK